MRLRLRPRTSGTTALAVIAGTVAAMVAAATSSWSEDPGAVKAKAQELCAACHGKAGVSEVENTPSLAGQHDQFTQWQLVYFRARTRKHDAMIEVAAALTDADIRSLGAYYASLPASPPPTSPDPDRALSERGARIAAQRNCGSCHLENYTGQQATGRLAGQREDYLLKALRDYKAGARIGGGVAAMPSTVSGLSDDDLKALAHFIAWRR